MDRHSKIVLIINMKQLLHELKLERESEEGKGETICLTNNLAQALDLA